MSKTKAQLSAELKKTQNDLLKMEAQRDKYSDNCYYAGKYLQVLRALGENFTQIDYDRVLNALEQDKYLD